MGPRQHRLGCGEHWIQLNRLLEIGARLERLRTILEAVEMIFAEQQLVISQRIICFGSGIRLGGTCHCKCPDDAIGNTVLDLENLADLAFVMLRPHVGAGFDVHQPGIEFQNLTFPP